MGLSLTGEPSITSAIPFVLLQGLVPCGKHRFFSCFGYLKTFVSISEKLSVT